VALQIAAAAPHYVRVEDIPEEVLEHEREIARNRAREEGKPEQVLDRIISGRIEKFKDEVCLLRQPYIRDEDLTIEKLLLQNIAAIGENIIVRRFVRWELGEESAQ
jgi:elongation factor Ts